MVVWWAPWADNLLFWTLVCSYLVAEFSSGIGGIMQNMLVSFAWVLNKWWHFAVSLPMTGRRYEIMVIRCRRQGVGSSKWWHLGQRRGVGWFGFNPLSANKGGRSVLFWEFEAYTVQWSSSSYKCRLNLINLIWRCVGVDVCPRSGRIVIF